MLQEDCFLEVGVDDGAEEGLEVEVEGLEEEMDCLVENIEFILKFSFWSIKKNNEKKMFDYKIT